MRYLVVEALPARPLLKLEPFEHVLEVTVVTLTLGLELVERLLQALRQRLAQCLQQPEGATAHLLDRVRVEAFDIRDEQERRNPAGELPVQLDEPLDAGRSASRDHTQAPSSGLAVLICQAS